jgi:hypothetical protein
MNDDLHWYFTGLCIGAFGGMSLVFAWRSSRELNHRLKTLWFLLQGFAALGLGIVFILGGLLARSQREAFRSEVLSAQSANADVVLDGAPVARPEAYLADLIAIRGSPGRHTGTTSEIDVSIHYHAAAIHIRLLEDARAPEVFWVVRTDSARQNRLGIVRSDLFRDWARQRRGAETVEQ